MYHRGTGVIQNFKTAAKWYKLAAHQGVAHSQFLLGNSYWLGEGVEQNSVLAHMWGNIARSQGHGIAERLVKRAAKDLNSKQIHRAQELAQKCFESNYTKCD